VSNTSRRHLVVYHAEPGTGETAPQIVEPFYGSGALVSAQERIRVLFKAGKNPALVTQEFRRYQWRDVEK